MRNGAVAALLVMAILAGAGAGYFVGNSSGQTSTSNCDALSCDSLSVSFQMSAARASNGSILFAGVITNNGRDPATSMRILVNGTDFGGAWTTTYSPGFPSPGTPLPSGSSVTFHARLAAGAPPAWPVACQSFSCSAGDKLLVEVDLFGNNTNFASSDTYITIGTG